MSGPGLQGHRADPGLATRDPAIPGLACLLDDDGLSALLGARPYPEQLGRPLRRRLLRHGVPVLPERADAKCAMHGVSEGAVARAFAEELFAAQSMVTALLVAGYSQACGQVSPERVGLWAAYRLFCGSVDSFRDRAEDWPADIRWHLRRAQELVA